ncbi:Uma2 family endonuclease [Kitasatospora sp. NPDC048722]|uniref:Uma2 family endonuclease n=1 Tax=Kitasatospora sp. NPDC048722 TaxID=3155639 RepID=UPI0033FDDCAC
MSELPDWMYPPRAEGWFADDLDYLPQAPRHTELIDGALVFMMSAQRPWHSWVVSGLNTALESIVPEGMWPEREIAIKLDPLNRPEPDVMVVTADPDPDRTRYDVADVVLVVEVVAPESAHRDRTVKFRKYAEAGIQHYWIVEEEDGLPVVHVFELEEVTSSYVSAGIFRGTLERPVPFPVVIDLDKLVSRWKRAKSAGD